MDIKFTSANPNFLGIGFHLTDRGPRLLSRVAGEEIEKEPFRANSRTARKGIVRDHLTKIGDAAQDHGRAEMERFSNCRLDAGDERRQVDTFAAEDHVPVCRYVCASRRSMARYNSRSISIFTLLRP